MPGTSRGIAWDRQTGLESARRQVRGSAVRRSALERRQEELEDARHEAEQDDWINGERD
jgi:hypothetical protein